MHSCPALNSLCESILMILQIEMLCHQKKTFVDTDFILIGKSPIVSCYLDLLIKFMNLTQKMMHTFNLVRKNNLLFT